jgi:uncharacterized protein YndB with AHSA1/START domain
MYLSAWLILNEEATPVNTDTDFVLSRIYAASREVLFRAFTDPLQLQHWWGPKGFVMVASEMNLRPGGGYHFGLRAPDGDMMWAKFVYREIDPPQRLVWVHSFSDEAGNVIKHPMSLDWPLRMLATVTFDVHDEGTKLTLRFSALDATEAERAIFSANHDSLQQGWTGTFDQLAVYLAASIEIH